MKIMVLAGGSDQIALIQELKHRGHYVLLIDYYENPVAAPYADQHIVASTLDVNAVYNIAKRENIDMVITACTDQALLAMAKVSESLGLPCYISYSTALKVTNKHNMKSVFVNNEIPTAKHKVITTSDSAPSFDFSFPVVVKPVDCNSSKGVKKCFNIDELRNNLQTAINYSQTKSAIVEEYKEGMEISADFFISGGKSILLCTTNTVKAKGTKSFTITKSYYPILSQSQESKIHGIGQQIADAFGLVDTPIFVQMILGENGDVFVIEFSARIGGGSKYKLIEVISGVDIMKVFVDSAFGEVVDVNPKKKINFASMNYVYCYDGVFSKLVGFEDLLHFQYKAYGSFIDGAETSSDRVASYLLTANSKDELISKMLHARRKIKVLDETGTDVVRHDLLAGDDI